jgi:hypothetical protein
MVADKPQPGAAQRGDEALKILLDKVPRMAAMANKSDLEMQMKSWSVVRAEESEVWIDLVGVNTAGGSEEHFIWKVHVTDLTVQPMSQSARRVMVKS